MGLEKFLQAWLVLIGSWQAESSRVAHRILLKEKKGGKGESECGIGTCMSQAFMDFLLLTMLS